MSRDTAYQRFFAIVKRLPPDWARVLATVDYRRRLALVVEARARGDDLELIAVGRYDALDEADTVEVAFVVQDSWQNRGLGTMLFDAILRAAAARSYRRFRAYVLADNRRMLDLITRFTRVESRKTEQSVTELVFSLVPSGPSPERSAASRERDDDRLALRRARLGQHDLTEQIGLRDDADHAPLLHDRERADLASAMIRAAVSRSSSAWMLRAGDVITCFTVTAFRS